MGRWGRRWGQASACAMILAACGTESSTESTPSDSSADATTMDAVAAPLDGSLLMDATFNDGEAIDATIADAGDLPPFDWVGIIGTGQSLSVGTQANGVISTTQPFKNGKLVDNGPDPKYPLDGGAPVYAISPLVEPIRPIPEAGIGQYPTNIYGETPHSGMANQITSLFLGRSSHDYVSLHSVVGWGGAAMLQIDKAGFPDGGPVGQAYPGSLAETRIFNDLAKAAGKSYGVGAVILTHGETDCALGNGNYQGRLTALTAAYNADIKAITGQTRNVVMLASQQSTCPGGLNSTAVQLWTAGLTNADIVCTGPKYQYGYAWDHLHLPAAGYVQLGEKYGEIFDIVVNQGKSWKPLQPSSALRTGASIEITFDVPNPPLQWDETLAPPHQSSFVAWKNGRGFEVLDSAANAVEITSATISPPNKVILALGENPSGKVTLSYALTQDCVKATPGTCTTPAMAGAVWQGGLPSGLRGQLRDSDELIGYDEESLTANVTNGSTSVTLSAGSTLAKRAVRDVVTGSGSPANWTIVSIVSPTQMTMHAPWTGTSGAVNLKVHHDLHNFAVHSSLVIP